MNKILLLTMLCFALCETSFSQTKESKKSGFQLSFFPPLGTNGLHSAQFTNNVSLNLLVGVSKNETVFTLGGLSNVILNDADGVQIAGLFNYVGNYGSGFQTAGFININKNYCCPIKK